MKLVITPACEKDHHRADCSARSCPANPACVITPAPPLESDKQGSAAGCLMEGGKRCADHDY
jgi:hypothetical protein